VSVIINMFGSPNSGKSTTAAALFAEMKKQGKDVELTSEYVKKWAWRRMQIQPLDQYYFFGQETQNVSRLLGNVDYIIQDSPFWLAGFYLWKRTKDTVLLDLCTNLMKDIELTGHNFINVYLNTSFDYVGEGRYETQKQAKLISEEIQMFLNLYKIPYIEEQEGDITKLMLEIGQRLKENGGQ